MDRELTDDELQKIILASCPNDLIKIHDFDCTFCGL